MAAASETYTLYDGSEYQVLDRPSGASDALVMRFVLIDHCGTPPPHVHPQATEVFEVEEGEFELLVGRDWRAVRAGESVTVPPGMRHSFRNHSGAEVVVRNVHDPHHDFEAYIRAVAALTHELQVTAVNNPLTAARMAMIWQRHDDLIQPADLPMKLAFRALDAAGRAARLKVP